MTIILRPIPDSDWRTPSQAQAKNMFGHENQTRFRVRARLNDGAIAWVGWFDDRDEADQFLYAIATDTLQYNRWLWNLPAETWTPREGYGNVGWQPWFDDYVTYDFATVVFVVSGASWTVPADCFGISGGTGEFIDTIGAGGSGGVQLGTNPGAGGGGGGGWSRVTTGVTLTAGGSVTISIASSVAGVTRTTTGQTVGNAGVDTWFNGANLAASSVGAKSGGGGPAPAAAGAGAGAGGAAASGIGASKNSGGNGGNINSVLATATGAGGGGGLNGNGVAGTIGSANTATAGGAGDNSSGGAGSAGVTASPATSGNASIGTEYDASHGSGGGSGGARAGVGAATSGSGGNYGGGSGGASGGGGGNCNSGAAGPGLIVVSYNPFFSATIVL